MYRLGNYLRRFFANCQGCGITLQHTEPKLQGYISEAKYKNLLTQNQKIEELIKEKKETEDIRIKEFKRVYRDQLKQITKDTPRGTREKIERKAKQEQKEEKKAKWEQIEQEIQSKKPEFLEIDNVDAIEEAMATATPMHEYTHSLRLKAIKCVRCINLGVHNKVDDTLCGVTHATSLEVMDMIFSEMKHGCVIMMMTDIIDFNGSFIAEVIDEAKKKKAKLILIGNKVDILPKNYKIERIETWIKQQIGDLIEDADICAVSSKTGEGMKQVIKLLARYKKTLPDAHFYVIGATNSGKSSFLNLLTKMTWNLPEEKYKKPLLADALTVSKLAGTTQALIPVKCRSLALTVFDTQGIPTASQMTSHLTNPESIFNLIPSKRFIPMVFVCHPNFSFWIGALTRIDMIEGDLKFMTFFTNNLCTVHKTKLEKVEDVYKRQAGKLLSPAFDNPEAVVFEKTRIEIPSSDREKASKDIVIHGLGWIAVSGRGNATFDVWAPKGVGVTVRPALMPFEAKIERRVPYNKTANAEKVMGKRRSKSS